MNADEITAEFLAIVRRSYKTYRAVMRAEDRAYFSYAVNGILDLEMYVNQSVS